MIKILLFNPGKEKLFRVSFTAKLKRMCSLLLNGLCMCHVHDNGRINNLKNKPLAKLACPLTLVFRSMFGKGKRQSSLCSLASGLNISVFLKQRRNYYNIEQLRSEEYKDYIER